MTPYHEYISNLGLTESSAYGKCERVCKAMLETFPDLTLIRGHYWDYEWGRRQHWWLSDRNGNVIDPTAMQFPSKGTGTYEPWDEGSPEPTGKCMQCGEYTYDRERVHSECMDAFNSYPAKAMVGDRKEK